MYGRVTLVNATALFYFDKKGSVQQLLHNLKYRGHEHIGEALGKWLGAALAEIEAYKFIDVVIPVPIHKTKLKKRGYNQVEKFGKAIATALGASYDDGTLVKTKTTNTQVFKDRINRLFKDESIFELKKITHLEGKHILLVDDIITTGATVEYCAYQLFKIPNIKLSLATIAITNYFFCFVIFKTEINRLFV